MSRHLYDIYRVWFFSDYKTDALDPKFYQEARDLQLKFRPQGLTADDYNPSAIEIIPNGSIKKAYENDYDMMINRMIFDPYVPSFDELLEKMAQIQEEIHSLKL